MATYIALSNFTDQGIRTVKETTKRAEAVREAAEKFGVKVKDIFWTLGQYDLVVIFEASDEAAIPAFGLSLGVAGDVRTQTFRAFSKEEMNVILSTVLATT